MGRLSKRALPGVFMGSFWPSGRRISKLAPDTLFRVTLTSMLLVYLPVRTTLPFGIRVFVTRGGVLYPLTGWKVAV